MNILLTNDDGIDSEGLQKLAGVLRAAAKHRVFVIAPDKDRSGVSHGITILKDPVKLSPAGEDSWSCSGTPADCVIVGLMGALPVKADLVLSGINRGANSGTDLIYSGTAAAARQASLAGVPAVAFSLQAWEGYYWDMAASWAAEHLDEFFGLWRKDCFINVNIPNSPGGPNGIVPAWPAVKDYGDELSVMDAPDGKRYCFLIPGEEKAVHGAGSDCEVLSRNFASVSAINNFPVLQGEGK